MFRRVVRVTGSSRDPVLSQDSRYGRAPGPHSPQRARGRPVRRPQTLRATAPKAQAAGTGAATRRHRRARAVPMRRRQRPQGQGQTARRTTAALRNQHRARRPATKGAAPAARSPRPPAGITAAMRCGCRRGSRRLRPPSVRAALALRSRWQSQAYSAAPTVGGGPSARTASASTAIACVPLKAAPLPPSSTGAYGRRAGRRSGRRAQHRVPRALRQGGSCSRRRRASRATRRTRSTPSVWR